MNRILASDWWRIRGPVSGNLASDADMVFVIILVLVFIAGMILMWRIGK